MAVVGVIVLFLLLYVVYLVGVLSKVLRQSEGMTEYEKAYEEQPFWNKVFQLNPLKLEKQLLMDHDFDGIYELNNPTPPWFMGLFYITIVFGFIYIGVYHVMGDGNIMETEYKEEVLAAEKTHEEYMKKFANSINEDNVKALADAKGLEAGALIYKQNCVACHGEKGEGKVGPNLTDEYWLHGGSIKNIFHTVTEGVPSKGMISWKKQLNPLQVQQVSSYIMTLIGTKPANAKEPQGEIYSPDAEIKATPVSTDSTAVDSTTTASN
ncbi:MAG: c-type cytochrome [Cytophagales bacterium]|nr:c-type cytochrome [Cytophagales bacterium]